MGMGKYADLDTIKFQVAGAFLSSLRSKGSMIKPTRSITCRGGGCLFAGIIAVIIGSNQEVDARFFQMTT